MATEGIPPRTTAPPVAFSDLTGKTVVVIGANTGLGFEAAKHFATMKPEKLIMACRDASRGQAALEKLQADTAYSKAEVWIVDLASFASVSAFADKALAELERLDILVANAAMGNFGPYTATKDGWEVMLQVNYLSQALLTLRLLPIVSKTAKLGAGTPRMVVVSSSQFLKVEWAGKTELLQAEAGIVPTLNSREYCTVETLTKHRYHETKLLDLFFSRTLQVLAGPSIIVNAVCPGFCLSDLRRCVPDAMKPMIAKVEDEFAYSTEEGSRQLVYAAVGGGEDEEALKGAFMSCMAVASVGDFVPSDEGVAAQKKIWEETLSILGDVDVKVKEIASV